VQEGIKSGNASETGPRYEISPTLFYRWKDEAERGAEAVLGGRSPAAAEIEKDHRIGRSERILGRKALEIEIPKKRRGEVSCGAVHSQARERVAQLYTSTLVAATLVTSSSNLYCRKQPRGSRADRTCDEQNVMQ